MLCGQVFSEDGGHLGHLLGVFSKSRDSTGARRWDGVFTAFREKMEEQGADGPFLWPLESCTGPGTLRLMVEGHPGCTGLSWEETEHPRGVAETGGREREKMVENCGGGVVSLPRGPGLTPGLCVFS